MKLSDKKPKGQKSILSPKPPNTQKGQKKTSSTKTKEVTKLRENLRKANRIFGQVEGLFTQLLGINWKEYFHDKNDTVEYKCWKKFDPKGKLGSQGRNMVIILEEIEKFYDQS